MSRVWREKLDLEKHRDFMGPRAPGGIPVLLSRDNLLTQWIYFAEVCKFTFQFISIEQVKECQEYFFQKLHPSTREIGHVWEHCWQAWYCKLPKGITKNANREKVLKALQKILDEWG